MALENVFSLFEDSRYEELFPNVRLLGNAVDYFIQCNTYEVLVLRSLQQSNVWICLKTRC